MPDLSASRPVNVSVAMAMAMVAAAAAVGRRPRRSRLEARSAHLFLGGAIIYSLHTRKEYRFGQRHGLQSLTLISYFYKKIYRNVIYLYFYENIFQDKSIHIIFAF